MGSSLAYLMVANDLSQHKLKSLYAIQETVSDCSLLRMTNVFFKKWGQTPELHPSSHSN